MYQELATYGGWACAIVAGTVAAANYYRLRAERAYSDNLYRRFAVTRNALRSVNERVTPKAKGAERDMAKIASDAFNAQQDIAREIDGGAA